MQFRLSIDQQDVLDAVGTLLSRHAGPARLRELGGDQPTYDHDLDKRLVDAGFLDLIEAGRGERLDAALIQEAISLSLGSVASASRLLVAPSLPTRPEGPMAIVADGHCGPARFAADADTILVIGAEAVRLVDVSNLSVPRTRSRLGYPVGDVADLPAGVVLDGVDPAEVLAWAQVAVTVELVGALRHATDLTVAYVIDRRQFDRPIGSFQAIQHGLAECAVAVEGARWLALEAAWNGSARSAALALTHALRAIDVVFPRTHQYCGAIGFTQEYDLHLATMRLPALRAEASALFGSTVVDSVTARVTPSR